MKDKEFEVCVRGIIQRQGKILVCWHKEKKYYFFPGGHIDFGETAEIALVRELKEELDIVVKKLSFVGVIENIYIEKRDKHKEHRGKHHEINLVFNVSAERVKDKSLEDHIDFVFLDIRRFAKERVLPIVFKKQVLKWLKDKKPFWVAQKESPKKGRGLGKDIFYPSVCPAKQDLRVEGGSRRRRDSLPRLQRGRVRQSPDFAENEF